ncbi:MAG TPA: aminotransferase class IV [Polyangiaceae bacterium]|nr:aminotransferase class IV [Polyangiaceae bacterium]
MPSRIAVIDGVTQPLEDAKVGVTDRGFLYGDSVFETIRTYGGKPYALGRHLSRLARSAEKVHIPLPLSGEELAREIEEAVVAAGNPESYVRVTITRGSGELGLDPSLAEKPLRVILVTPLVAPAPEAYERGISAVTYRVRRASDATDAAGAKIGNYLVSVLAMRQAKAAGAGEALIVDGDGHVVEGATSNVFFVKGEGLLTPPEDAGILSGITRQTMLDVAKDLGVRVEQRAPVLAELPTFQEAFITSSIRELLPVVRIDETTVGAGVPGPVSKKLLAAFRERTRRDLA